MMLQAGRAFGEYRLPSLHTLQSAAIDVWASRRRLVMGSCEIKSTAHLSTSQPVFARNTFDNMQMRMRRILTESYHSPPPMTRAHAARICVPCGIRCLRVRDFPGRSALFGLRERRAPGKHSPQDPDTSRVTRDSARQGTFARKGGPAGPGPTAPRAPADRPPAAARSARPCRARIRKRARSADLRSFQTRLGPPCQAGNRT